MKRIAIMLILLLVAASLRADTCRVLSWDERSVTVEFVSGEPSIEFLEPGGLARLCRIDIPGFSTICVKEGEPLLPVGRFLFAVPAREDVRFEIVESDLVAIDGLVPAPFMPEASIAEQKRAVIDAEGGEFARLVDVGTYRKRSVAVVEYEPVQYDRNGPRLIHAVRVVARISFPPAPAGRFVQRPDSPLDGVIVNKEQALGWDIPVVERSSAQRTPFEFALSDDWLRIRVAEKGIYIITYNDLISAGVDPSRIDPSTLRLFGAPPYNEPDSVDSGGSFEEQYHLVEHALLYRGAASTEFMPGDMIFFYGLGVDAWADDIDPARSHRLYVEHPYESRNTYWLTWGGDFDLPARRMSDREVAPLAPYDIEVTSYEARQHIEQDQQYDACYTDDRWYWLVLDPEVVTNFSNSFSLDQIVGPAGVVRTQAYGPYKNTLVQNADYYLNGSHIGSLNWSTSYDYDPLDMPVLEAEVANLVQGANTFTVNKTWGNAMYILWYEVFYNRPLQAVSGFLDFYAPSESGSAHMVLNGYPVGTLYIFDVTDRESPVFLEGWQRTGQGAELEDILDGTPRHYIALHTSALKHPDIEIATVTSLRDDPVCPDMVVIYNGMFQEAAAVIGNLRAGGVPYAPNPYVKTIDVQSVYDNFSCGRKDPIAIRNYLKFLYDSFDDGGEPVLRYVLLIGNGTYDARDRLGRGNDFLPLYMNRNYANEQSAVEDDDFYVKLDEGYDRYTDVAIGRLCVLDRSEANGWADLLVTYSGGADLGAWRNKVILVADDEFGPRSDEEFYFMNDAEDMCDDESGQFPRFVDFKKVYLHHYPLVGSRKPAARRDLLDSWSEGALIVNYAGHGSPYQMASEFVMEDSDVYSLTNGTRRPVVISFSCTTGNLESPYRRSLSQVMCAYAGGGAIATISAVEPTYPAPNTILNRELFEALFTSRDSTGTEPVGYALQLAKMKLTSITNNAKYALLGDPAMSLALPAYTVEHDVESIDTLYTGIGYTVHGTVRAGGQVFNSFNGTVDLIVQEAEEHIDKFVLKERIYADTTIIDSIRVQYDLAGDEFFRGTGDVVGGRFTMNFFVPLTCRTGPDARVRSYVMGSATDGIGAVDTLALVPNDTIPTNAGPPHIELYFANQATRVKTGARLVADIVDPDGIAILGKEPENSIFLEFDSGGLPIFVTEYFSYEHGSSTRGRVEYPLHSGFSPGPHTVVLKAFDNLGASSTDTLRFEIIEEGIYTISDVFNFPNPFIEGTNFVFQLSNPAEVRLQVYNVSGVRIWERRMYGEEGFNNLYWDGRDMAGDRPANGTYLYFLEVEFRDSFHRKESVKGKMVLLR
jgi:hypothetical protein